MLLVCLFYKNNKTEVLVFVFVLWYCEWSGKTLGNITAGVFVSVNVGAIEIESGLKVDLRFSIILGSFAFGTEQEYMMSKFHVS